MPWQVASIGLLSLPKWTALLRQVALLSAAGGFLALLGCTTPSVPTPAANPANPIRTVAVLPFINNTNDVEAPVYVRAHVTHTLRRFFYEVKSLKRTDELLKNQLGITLGGQLDMPTPQKLGETLGVDAVLYGSLENFDYTVTGVYNTRRVRLRAKLVNCKTGETVWRNGIGVVSGSMAAGGMLTGQVPYLNEAISRTSAVAAVGSRVHDQNDSALPTLLGDQIEAPWHRLPEGLESLESNILLGFGKQIAEKTEKRPLREETIAAARILLYGYYYDGGDIQPYGIMLPGGPAAPMP